MRKCTFTLKFKLKPKKIISIIISLSLVVSSLPARAFARSYLAAPGCAELSKSTIDFKKPDKNHGDRTNTTLQQTISRDFIEKNVTGRNSSALASVVLFALTVIFPGAAGFKGEPNPLFIGVYGLLLTFLFFKAFPEILFAFRGLGQNHSSFFSLLFAQKGDEGHGKTDEKHTDNTVAKSNEQSQESVEGNVEEKTDEIFIIDEIDISVSSGDVGDVGIELLALIEGCPEGHRMLFSCRPKTPAELLAVARPLGFGDAAVSWREELAHAITEEVLRENKPVTKKVPVTLSGQKVFTRTHTIIFPEGIELCGYKYESVTLLTSDTDSNEHFERALSNADVKNVRKFIASLVVDILDFPMAIKTDYAVEKLIDNFTNNRQEKEKYMKTLISTEKAAEIREEQKSDMAATKELERLDLILDTMNELIERCQWIKAYELMQGDKTKIPAWLKKRDSKWLQQVVRIESSFTEKKQIIALGLAQEKIQNGEYRSAQELLTWHVDVNKHPEVIELLEEIENSIKAQDKTDEDKNVQKRVDEIKSLLSDGLWYKAWDAVRAAQSEFPHRKEFVELADEVGTKARSGVAGHDRVPEWLPPEQSSLLVELAMDNDSLMDESHEFEKNSGKITNEKTLQRKKFELFTRYENNVKKLVDCIITLPKDVWDVINQKARRTNAILLNPVDDSKWPASFKEFKEIMKYIFHPPLGKQDTPESRRYAEEIMSKDLLARSLISAFAYVIPGFYDTKDPYKGEFRLQYLSGEGGAIDYEITQELSYHIAEDGGEASEKEQESINSAVEHSVQCMEEAKAEEDPDKIKQLIANSFKLFIENDIKLPLLYRAGWGPYPSMMFSAGIVEAGAVPILSPKEIAEKLRTNPIHKKDIIISRDGQTIIRVFMGDGGVFKSPISANGVCDIYALDPKDKKKTIGVPEAREIVDDNDKWETMLKQLEESNWESEKMNFYIGGIDYDFITRQGIERLIEAVYPDRPDTERQLIVDNNWNELEDSEERYSSLEKEYPQPSQALMDAYTRRFCCVVNYYMHCHDYLSKQGKNAEYAARYFIETILESAYQDIRTQVRCALTRDNYMIDDDIIRGMIEGDSMSNKDYGGSFSILKTAINILAEWKQLTSDGVETVNAPWEVLVGWDYRAPEEEVEGERAWRSWLWSKTVDTMAGIIVRAWNNLKDMKHDDIFNHAEFSITNDGHVESPHMMSILSKIGYVPKINHGDFVDLLREYHQDAVLSAAVIPSRNEYCPVLVINLNVEKDWILKNYIPGAEVPEGEEGRIRFLLFKESGELIKDDNVYHQFIEGNNLKLSDDGTPLLAKALANGKQGITAKPVVIYAFVDVERFSDALLKGAKKENINRRVAESILNHMRKKEVKKIKSLEDGDVLPKLAEVRNKENVLEKVRAYEKAGDFRRAIKRINKTLRKKHKDTSELLAAKQRIARIITRNRVVAHAEKLFDTDDLEAAEKALKDIEIHFCGPDEEATKDVMLKKTESDKEGFNTWQKLKTAVDNLKQQAEKRKEKLDEAEKLLNNEDFGEAVAKVDEATEYGGHSTDTNSLLKRIEDAEKQKDAIDVIITSMEEIRTDLSKNKIDIEDLSTYTVQVESIRKKIEKIDWKDYDYKLGKSSDYVMKSLVSKREHINKIIQERKTRIIERLQELENKLATLEAPKDIIALKKHVTTQENAVQNVPSKSTRKELVLACTVLKVKIEAKANKAVEEKIQEIPEALQDVDKEISLTQTTEDTKALRERLNAVKRGINQVLQAEEKQKLLNLYQAVSSRLSVRHAELKAQVDKEKHSIESALYSESHPFFPKQIKAQKEQLQNLRKRSVNIPPQEVRDELLEKINEIEVLMDEAHEKYVEEIEQQTIIDKIDKPVGMYITSLKNWKITGRHGMIEEKIKPEDLTKPALELLNRLDLTIPIARKYFDRRAQELNAAVAAKNNDLREAKKEIEVSRPVEEKQARQEAEDQALTYLADLEAKIDPEASFSELNRLKQDIGQIPGDVWQCLDSEQKMGIKEEQERMKDTIDALLAEKSGKRKTGQKDKNTKISLEISKQITEIIDNLPGGYKKLNNAVRQYLIAKVIGNETEIDSAQDKIAKELNKIQNMDPSDLQKYQEACKFDPKPGPGSLGGLIKRTLFAKTFIGKLLRLDTYSSFRHAPVLEELKVAIPFGILWLLNTWNPGMPSVNILIFVVCLAVCAGIYVPLHILNDRISPKGIINKIKFICREIKDLTPKERHLLFTYPMLAAGFGVFFSVAAVVILGIIIGAPFWTVCSAGIILSMAMHHDINLEVREKRKKGEHYGFATLTLRKPKTKIDDTSDLFNRLITSNLNYSIVDFTSIDSCYKVGMPKELKSCTGKAYVNKFGIPEKYYLDSKDGVIFVTVYTEKALDGRECVVRYDITYPGNGGIFPVYLRTLRRARDKALIDAYVTQPRVSFTKARERYGKLILENVRIGKDGRLTIPIYRDNVYVGRQEFSGRMGEVRLSRKQSIDKLILYETKEKPKSTLTFKWETGRDINTGRTREFIIRHINRTKGQRPDYVPYKTIHKKGREGEMLIYSALGQISDEILKKAGDCIIRELDIVGISKKEGKYSVSYFSAGGKPRYIPSTYREGTVSVEWDGKKHLPKKIALFLVGGAKKVELVPITEKLWSVEGNSIVGYSFGKDEEVIVGFHITEYIGRGKPRRKPDYIYRRAYKTIGEYTFLVYAGVNVTTEAICHMGKIVIPDVHVSMPSEDEKGHYKSINAGESLDLPIEFAVHDTCDVTLVNGRITQLHFSPHDKKPAIDIEVVRVDGVITGYRSKDAEKWLKLIYVNESDRSVLTDSFLTITQKKLESYGDDLTVTNLKPVTQLYLGNNRIYIPLQLRGRSCSAHVYKGRVDWILFPATDTAPEALLRVEHKGGFISRSIFEIDGKVILETNYLKIYDKKDRLVKTRTIDEDLAHELHENGFTGRITGMMLTTDKDGAFIFGGHTFSDKKHPHKRVEVHYKKGNITHIRLPKVSVNIYVNEVEEAKIEEHLGFAWFTLKRLFNFARMFGIEPKELIERAGKLGLMKALRKYDEKQNKFITYASRSVWWEAINLLYKRSNARSINVVKDEFCLFRILHAIEGLLTACEGKRPPAKELAKRYLLDKYRKKPTSKEIREFLPEIKKYRANKNMLIRIGSLNVDGFNEDERTPQYSITEQKRERDPSDNVAYNNGKKHLDDALDRLAPVKQRILNLVLHDPRKLSWEAIGAEVKLSHEKARLLFLEALQELKEDLTRNGFSKKMGDYFGGEWNNLPKKSTNIIKLNKNSNIERRSH